MPIKFITLNKKFKEKMEKNGYECYNMRIEEYEIKRRTYYISPANSLCFMDGGLDKTLSRKIFSNIEKEIKEELKKINKKNLLGRYYLPIGSSIIIEREDDKLLCVSPTMLLPQNVSETNNAYYCTMAALYNILINKKEDINKVDIILTSLCCGYGKMDIDKSINQILKGIKDYKNYKPEKIINENIIINEPNLEEQPKYYQNTEFFNIDVNDIIKS